MMKFLLVIFGVWTLLLATPAFAQEQEENRHVFLCIDCEMNEVVWKVFDRAVELTLKKHNASFKDSLVMFILSDVPPAGIEEVRKKQMIFTLTKADGTYYSGRSMPLAVSNMAVVPEIALEAIESAFREK